MFFEDVPWHNEEKLNAQIALITEKILETTPKLKLIYTRILEY